MKTCFCQVIQVSWELTRDLCQCSLNTKGQGCCVPKKGCDCDNESITVGVRDFFFSSLQNTFLSASCVLCQSSVKSWHLSKSTPAAPSIKRLSLFVFQDIIVYFLEYLFITNLTSVVFFFFFNRAQFLSDRYYFC